MEKSFNAFLFLAAQGKRKARLQTDTSCRPSLTVLTMCEQNLRHGHVGRGGELHVLAVALHQVDGVPHGLYYGRIVGEAGGVFLQIGLLEQGRAEHLRGLDEAVGAAVHGAAAALREATYAVHGFDDGNGGGVFGGGAETPLQGRGADERTDAIVHGGERARCGGKPVADGVEARFAAGDNAVRHGKTGAGAAQVLPIAYLPGGQDQNNLQVAAEGMEGFQRVHEHGLPRQGQELLGNKAVHAAACSAGYYDGCIGHIFLIVGAGPPAGRHPPGGCCGLACLVVVAFALEELVFVVTAVDGAVEQPDALAGFEADAREQVVLGTDNPCGASGEVVLEGAAEFSVERGQVVAADAFAVGRVCDEEPQPCGSNELLYGHGPEVDVLVEARAFNILLRYLDGAQGTVEAVALEVELPFRAVVVVKAVEELLIEVAPFFKGKGGAVYAGRYVQCNHGGLYEQRSGAAHGVVEVALPFPAGHEEHSCGECLVERGFRLRDAPASFVQGLAGAVQRYGALGLGYVYVYENVGVADADGGALAVFFREAVGYGVLGPVGNELAVAELIREDCGVYCEGVVQPHDFLPVESLYVVIDLVGICGIEGEDGHEDARGGPQVQVGFVEQCLVALEADSPPLYLDFVGAQPRKFLREDFFQSLECLGNHVEYGPRLAEAAQLAIGFVRFHNGQFLFVCMLSSLQYPRSGGHVGVHPYIASYDGSVADGYVSQDGSIGVYDDIVADAGVTLYALYGVSILVEGEALGSECHALVHLHVVSYHGCFANDDACSVVDGEVFADLRARVYVNAGFGVGHLGDDSRYDRHAHLQQGVCHAVVEYGLQAGITEDDLAMALGCGVTVVGGHDILLQGPPQFGQLPDEGAGELSCGLCQVLRGASGGIEADAGLDLAGKQGGEAFHIDACVVGDGVGVDGRIAEIAREDECPCQADNLLQHGQRGHRLAGVVSVAKVLER